MLIISIKFIASGAILSTDALLYYVKIVFGYFSADNEGGAST